MVLVLLTPHQLFLKVSDNLIRFILTYWAFSRFVYVVVIIATLLRIKC